MRCFDLDKKTLNEMVHKNRRSVLEQFEEQKEYLDEKINFGIEQYRKGYADIIINDQDGNAAVLLGCDRT